jgi:hypothetical protein
MHQFSINSMSFIQIFSECGIIVIKLMLASPDRPELGDLMIFITFPKGQPFIDLE